MMDSKKVIGIILSLILVILSIPLSSSKDMNYDFDPTIDDWYSIEDWEVEYCKKWGGKKVEGEVNSGAESETTYSLSQLTISLQAEAIYYGIENQSTLYYASWYIEPLVDMEYKVLFTGDSDYYLQNGTATYEAPVTGYLSEYINQTFNYLKIQYTGNSIKVPIQW